MRGPVAIAALVMVGTTGAAACLGFDGVRNREAMVSNCGEAGVRVRLDNALMDQGSLEQALAGYRMAIRLKPDYAEAHYNLGIALAAQGKLEEAVAEFRAAIRLKPDYAEAHYNLGNALLDQGKLEEAIAEFRTAIRLKPDYAEAHYNLGVALEAQGKPEEAIAEFRTAIRLKPDTRRGPLQPRHRPEQTRGSWRRRSPNSARRSGSSPTTPRPTTTSASP